MPTSQRTKGSGSQGSQAGTGRVTGQGLGGFRLTQNQRRELPGSTTLGTARVAGDRPQSSTSFRPWAKSGYFVAHSPWRNQAHYRWAKGREGARETGSTHLGGVRLSVFPVPSVLLTLGVPPSSCRVAHFEGCVKLRLLASFATARRTSWAAVNAPRSTCPPKLFQGAGTFHCHPLPAKQSCCFA